MLNQPENNLKLSDDQALAIEETKSRLVNLEAEISIANKNLKGIKLENEKAIKEKIYLEELLASLAPQIESKQSELQKINDSITEQSAVLSDLINKAKEQIKVDGAKELELKTREIELKAIESKVFREAEELKEESAKVAEDKKKIDGFIEQLSAVIKSW
jgi:predicted  nucleic acid-binding Zn-ribbon protein